MTTKRILKATVAFTAVATSDTSMAVIVLAIATLGVITVITFRRKELINN